MSDNNDSDFEVGHHVDKDKLPRVSPQLSESLVPVYLFCMTTKHNRGDILAKFVKQFPHIPAEAAKRVLGDKLAGGLVVEYNTLLVARDKDGVHSVYAQHAHRHGDTGPLHEVEVPMQVDSGSENGLASAKVSALNCQYNPDWNGERVLPAIELEADTHAEMLGKLREAGIYDLFVQLFPDTITDENPVTAMVPTATPASREALVKRFGAKAIGELEARITDKSKKHDKA